MLLALLLSPFLTFASRIHPILLGNNTYNKNISPFDDTGENITFYVDASLIVLVAVEENQQLVSYLVFLNYTWIDRRLAYNMSEVEVPYVVAPANLLWIPWLNCWNCFEVKIFEQINDGGDAGIYPDGLVSTYFRARLDTICKCDISAFPFDVQFCSINFDTGYVDFDRLLLIPVFNKTGADYALIGTPEWKIEYYSEFVGESSVGMRIHYKLTRNGEFYVFFMILPTILITATCIAVTLLPSTLTTGEKVSMGVTGLLGLTFLLSIIVQEVPRSKNLPVIGKWLLIEMFFCILAMTLIYPIKKMKKSKFCFQRKEYNFCFLIEIAIFVVITVAHLLTSLLLFIFPGELKEPPQSFI